MVDASDVLVEGLLAWGVGTFWGLPGNGINGVFEALRKQKDRIRFIHVRHEEAAAFILRGSLRAALEFVCAAEALAHVHAIDSKRLASGTSTNSCFYSHAADDFK